jgi:uncharacterized protein (DUF1499 family)
MKAGNIKKFLDKVIASERRDNLDPHNFDINDSFILEALNSYCNNDPPQHIERLVNGFINTEQLSVERRVSVLKLVKDVLIGMSEPGVNKEQRERLRNLLSAYYI